jgi:hypothetical protein
MASAADTYEYSNPVIAAIVQGYLGMTVPPESDAQVQLWWAAALDDCDQYVGWDWTDDDGNDVAHDNMVLIGLLEWVKAMKSHYDRPAGSGVGMVKTGPLQENYRTDAGGIGVALARQAAYPFWQPSKYDLSLLGLGYK